MWLPILAAGAGMASAVIVDIVASRLGAGRMQAYGMSFLCGLLLTLLALFLAGLSWSAASEPLATGALALLLYGSWWFIFLNFVQSFDSSLRVRILALLHDVGGRLPRIELYKRYNDQLLLELRMERLLKGGFVVERDGRLFVASARLRSLATLSRALKIVLTGRRSEFNHAGGGKSG